MLPSLLHFPPPLSSLLEINPGRHIRGLVAVPEATAAAASSGKCCVEMMEMHTYPSRLFCTMYQDATAAVPLCPVSPAQWHRQRKRYSAAPSGRCNSTAGMAHRHHRSPHQKAFAFEGVEWCTSSFADVAVERLLYSTKIPLPALSSGRSVCGCGSDTFFRVATNTRSNNRCQLLGSPQLSLCARVHPHFAIGGPFISDARPGFGSDLVDILH